MTTDAGLVNSFLAAIQASLSVLLVIFYGGVAAHFNLLSSSSTKAISKVCVKLFLPALLFTQIGSELHLALADRYLIILLWAFICHFLSFLVGIFAHIFFKMPDWITAAIMFNNTTSYPLLLVQSLDQTGILSALVTGDEGTKKAIERAKAYFLVFATVSSCLTFAVGPRLIDSEHAPDIPDDKSVISDDEIDEGYDGDEEAGSGNGFGERSRLLSAGGAGEVFQRRLSVAPAHFFPSKPNPDVIVYDRRPSVISRKKWHGLGDRARWWALFLYDFLNAPLLGAVLGSIVGLAPVLHRAFFNDTSHGGFFTAWLTESLKTIGSVFVPLPVVVAGVSLYLSINTKKSEDGETQAPTPWLTTLFILVVRFVVWPVISIGVIYLLAKNTGLLSDDPMLWFALMLMPTGPPAMKLITMIQVSSANDEDEQKVAKLLTISYIISPVLAFTVVGSLRASLAAI